MSEINKYKTIKLNNILNYDENPRHDIATNQQDTLKKLIDKVGAQYMFNLTKDIYINGLIAANVPVVVWDESQKKYIVYEGNRRIACLKILENPSLIEGFNNPLKDRIEKMKSENTSNYSTNVQCLVTSKEHAFFIMERIHAGEDKGRGLKAWSSKEKQVFDQRKNGESSIELIISQLNKQYLGEDITQKIAFTNLQRFFNNRAVKKALGIKNNTDEISKDVIILINYLIDEAIKKSEMEKVSLSRLFNKSRDIEDFFIPIITDYSNSQIDSPQIPLQQNNATDFPEKMALVEESQKPPINDKTIENGVLPISQNKGENVSISIDVKNITHTNAQTINLHDYLNIDNIKEFNLNLLEIHSEDLVIHNGIVQPGSMVGNHVIIFKYYESINKENVYWQDSLTIKIIPLKTIRETPKSKTALSLDFVNKYYEFLNFEHSGKFKALMCFLSEETIDGKNANVLNIVSRMFLEYSFRLYASEVLKMSNSDIDSKSSSLPGFIGMCCNTMDREAPDIFVKHVTLGKKDAINKIDILQKSVHYYDVDISPLDIQNIFKNLGSYLDYAYSKLIKVTNS
ncbi:hypothetical protein [Lysinibacillus sphaericus]|uniref:hypothetical protein n=1 Tax=Lysinibacillus sphaericus TaxID=1421 RepID=UPI000C1A0327|nr:hypothetical protein [Lysinibacillus sphaericus]PIJ98220.1 hypothetical protein CTN02_09285 [Lysinibacillus sphaericus]